LEKVSEFWLDGKDCTTLIEEMKGGSSKNIETLERGFPWLRGIIKRH
jgi:hypothetical protein